MQAAVQQIDFHALPTAAQLDAEYIARKGLLSFVECAWPQIEPQEYVHNWHVEEVCAHLEAVTRGDIRRLIINVPPGTSKSLLTSVMWPLWEWTRSPKTKWLFASFDETLAVRDARRVRNLLQSKWWKDRWPHIFIPKNASSAWSEFDNNHGGFRFSTSIGGRGTGRHGNRKVIDDPHKPLDLGGLAETAPKKLQEALDWHANTWSSRNSDPRAVTEVVIMQRLNERDLTGYLTDHWTKANVQFEHLCLPMRFEPKRKCKTRFGGDRRTKDGELLDKNRFDDESVRLLQADLRTSRNVAAQHQQTPAPAEGNIIKTQWIKHWGVKGSQFEKLPPLANMKLFQSWDATFKGLETSDWVVGMVWGIYRNQFAFLLDMDRKQVGFLGTLKMIRDMSAKWPGAWLKRIEDKANGPAIQNVLQGQIAGIEMVNPEGDKADRLRASEGLFEAGTVFLPPIETHPWVAIVIHELTQFPGAANDDTVDATSQALLELSKTGSVDTLANFNAEMLKLLGAAPQEGS